MFIVPSRRESENEKYSTYFTSQVIQECVCAALKIIKNTVRRTLKECETCNSPGKKVHSFHWVLL
jgi:hypothetical protein